MSDNGRLRGGYDVDDVKLDLNSDLLEFASTKLGRKITYESLTSYNLGVAFSISHEEGQGILVEFCEQGGLERLQPVTGAVKALQHLSAFSDDYTLTARDVIHADVTHRTLKLNFVDRGMPIKSVDFCFNHHALCGTKRKADIAQRLALHYMVEDSPENASEVAAKGIPVFLLRRKWNEHIASEGLITACHNWEEVVEQVEKLKRDLKI